MAVACSGETFPGRSGAWRVRFHWYFLATGLLGVVGAWFGGAGVPAPVGIAAATGAIAATTIGTWAAARVALCVAEDQVRYCNGFVVMTCRRPEISGVVLRRETVPFSASFGIQLLTRGPTGDAPREYRLGTVPFVSVGLPLADRQRLVAALAGLLGDDAVSSLRPWSLTGDAGASGAGGTAPDGDDDARPSSTP